MSNWKTRARAAGIHLGISLLVAGGAAWLVFGIWFPPPYNEISGGRELFTLVVAVDVVLGPLITFVVFDLRKPLRERVLDLSLVGLIQLGALAYGLWSVHMARPVHLVFEFDRFRVVHMVDVPEELLPRAPAALQALPLTGPTPLAVRPFRDANEKAEATLAAIAGLPLAARPDLWQDYAAARVRVLQAARPLASLRERFAGQAGLIEQAVVATGRPEAQLFYLPMVSRKATAWTVLVDAGTALPVAYLPLDSF